MVKYLIIIFIFLAYKSSAVIYTLASDGSGTFTTLSQASAHTYAAGDELQIRKGDTFYGTLTISQSGTLSNPIVVTSYGTGANPIITGFTTVSTWTNLGSNIWESTSAVSTLSTCNMVAVNGVNTEMGRYPNANATNYGYIYYQSHSGNTSITSNSLSGTTNWTGATAVIRCNHFEIANAVITSQSGGTLTFSSIIPTPTDGTGFFIQNDSRTLDAQNEWYFNPSTKKIQVFSTSQPTDVKISTVTNLCNITTSYVTIDGISFTGSNGSAIIGNGTSRSGITIKNSIIQFVGISAISGLISANYLVENNTIADVNTDVVDASNIIFRNNTINNIGLFRGMNVGYNAASFGSNSTVEYNSLTNVGHNGFGFFGNNLAIQYNIIDTFCSLLDDGGGIYTYTGGQTPLTGGILLKNNIVLNGIGAPNSDTSGDVLVSGIYLDDNTQNVEISGNTVANCSSYGFFLHNASYINLHDNISYLNSNALLLADDEISGTVQNDIIKSNTFLTEADWCVFYASTEDTKINPNGIFDSNYYIRINYPTFPIRIQTSNLSDNDQNLAYWQSFSGQDSHSQKSPYVITDPDELYLAYNATSSASNVSLPAKYKDLSGNEYNGTISLGEFASKVLFYVGETTSPTTKTKGISAGNGKMWGKNGVPYGL